ncbi:MAG: acyl-CoA dehydrogenase family protein [Syntrophobacteraceae bacterium]
MFPRTLFPSISDSPLFRDPVRYPLRRYMETNVMPHHECQEGKGCVDRGAWAKAGASGFLCPSMPEKDRGGGVDISNSAIFMEDQFRIGAGILSFSPHSEIVGPYILHHDSEYLKSPYLPTLASGKMIGAISMSEPGAGSDMEEAKTATVRDGELYRLNRSKTFINNHWHRDLVIVVVKRDHEVTDQPQLLRGKE